MNLKKASLKSTLFTAAIIFLLLFSVIFVWIGVRNSAQSEAPMFAGVSFQGEYQIGDGDWRPYTKGEHIPADQGDVTLRGTFLRHNPETGEAIGILPPNNTINLYFDHIGGTVIFPSGGKMMFDAENDQLGEDACAIMWGSLPSPGETLITIVLHNPHEYGNADAIDEFFANMSAIPGSYLEKTMLEQGENERTIGTLILIISTVILGIAAFSSIIHIQYSKAMWLIGFMSFFAGGYFMFDAFAVSFWNDSNIFNTRALGLCMMLYTLFGTALIVTQFRNRIKKIGAAVLLLSAATIVACITISMVSPVKFYDTWFWWAVVEMIVALTLIVCQIISFRHSPRVQKFLYLVGISTFFAFILDVAATSFGFWEGGLASKFVFLVIFAIALVVVLRIIPSHINASVRARELKAEKQALQLELQESRISIMLSQMQPHFIFNTLNTIYHLCEINPEAARSTIESFATYLRNNIDNLNRSEMIHFDQEMSFVEAYLNIEKVRFDDELQITFDMPVTNFKLPVLTVQPIVENAVKHGTSKKEGVSSLFITTRETDTSYEIEIRDTGVGFDTTCHHDDAHKHIGIDSVRQRLKNLCDGTLTIESKIGEGTTATISIPKKEETQ